LEAVVMTKRDFVIRPAIATDMNGVADIYGKAVQTSTASFEHEPPDTSEMTRRWKAVVADNFPYLAAVGEYDRVLGYGYLHAYHARPAYAATVENSVYVAETARRSGVGKALMIALIDAARALGLREIIAVIGDPDGNPSVALHAALGFRDVGRLTNVGRKFKRLVDVALMQKTL
ncbi:MAG: GNAT family N-acetyltransferase, partial [Methyloligellaceae bacterium]